MRVRAVQGRSDVTIYDKNYWKKPDRHPACQVSAWSDVNIHMMKIIEKKKVSCQALD